MYNIGLVANIMFVAGMFVGWLVGWLIAKPRKKKDDGEPKL